MIRGTGAGPAISFLAVEGEPCRLVGFVIAGANHQGEGGGVLCNGSAPILANCVIEGNSAQRGGAIASLPGASPRLINCLLRGNSAEMGGAVYCTGGDVSLYNCTLAANTATQGASLACRSPRLASPSHVSIHNCILWNQSDEIVNLDASIVDITYSTVYGGWPGIGNLDGDPLFVREAVPAEADWGDLRLRNCSMSADAGTITLLPTDSADLDGDGDTDEMLPLDLGGRPRLQGAAVDIGAYETMRIGRLLADMNGDCAVDAGDLLMFTTCGTGAAMGPPDPVCEPADLDGDDDVDQDDFGLFQVCLNSPAALVDPACVR